MFGCLSGCLTLDFLAHEVHYKLYTVLVKPYTMLVKLADNSLLVSLPACLSACLYTLDLIAHAVHVKLYIVLVKLATNSLHVCLSVCMPAFLCARLPACLPALA